MTLARTKRAGGRMAVLGSVVLGVLALAGTAMAAVPVTVVSQDPYTNTSSYHQTEVEPDTFSFGSTIVSTFQVGRFFDGGASNLGWATSNDNGSTWMHGFLPRTTVYSDPPGPWDRISDPSVAYDPEHGAWMITGLAIVEDPFGVTGKAVLVSRSTDGGLTWQNPVTVSEGGGGAFYDKEWVACDTWASSPAYGNCYVEWDNNGIFRMSRSTNGGLSWADSSVPRRAVIGGQPVVQPNGTVVVPIQGSGMDSYVSVNGGASYTGPYDIASINEHLVRGGLRTSALPSAELDGNGRVFVVWQDCRFRSGCSANDIVMSSSADGKNWSPVSRIPIAPASSAADFFIPGIAVDRTTAGSSAHLGLTFYFYPQASCSASTCDLGAGFISSSDGGATWSAPVRIFENVTLTWLAQTDQGYMVGDYISTSFGSNGKAYPVIAGARPGACDLGQITSCHEAMVAPIGGLSMGPGVHPIEHPRQIARGRQPAATGRTAF